MIEKSLVEAVENVVKINKFQTPTWDLFERKVMLGSMPPEFQCLSHSHCLRFIYWMVRRTISEGGLLNLSSVVYETKADISKEIGMSADRIKRAETSLLQHDVLISKDLPRGQFPSGRAVKLHPKFIHWIVGEEGFSQVTFPSFESILDGTRSYDELKTALTSALAGVKLSDQTIAVMAHVNQLLFDYLSYNKPTPRDLDWYQMMFLFKDIIPRLNQGMADACFSTQDDRLYKSIKDSIDYMLSYLIREEGGY